MEEPNGRHPRCARCGEPLAMATPAVPRIEVRCRCGAWSVVVYRRGAGYDKQERRGDTP